MVLTELYVNALWWDSAH